MIKVFLAGKNHIFFREIEQLLKEASIQITGSCINPVDLLHDLNVMSADVILLDAKWEGSELKGTAILPNLLELNPLMKIVMVTTFNEKRIAGRCREEQLAKGYLYRYTDSIQSIIQCISTVAAGGTFFTE